MSVESSILIIVFVYKDHLSQKGPKIMNSILENSKFAVNIGHKKKKKNMFKRNCSNCNFSLRLVSISL